MARFLYGEKIAKRGKLLLGCSATIFDESKNKILLTKRTDNEKWCLPGGGLESGESVKETCVREVLEETSLEVQIVGLLGIYSDPNCLVEYPDGNQYHLIALNFEAEVIRGELNLSKETTAYGYFSRAEISKLDLLRIHEVRINDAFSKQTIPFIR